MIVKLKLKLKLKRFAKNYIKTETKMICSTKMSLVATRN